MVGFVYSLWAQRAHRWKFSSLVLSLICPGQVMIIEWIIHLQFIYLNNYSWFPFPCQPAETWVVDLRVSVRRCFHSHGFKVLHSQEERLGCAGMWMPAGPGLCVFIFFLGELAGGKEILWSVSSCGRSSAWISAVCPASSPPFTPEASRSFGVPSHLIEEALHLQVKCGIPNKESWRLTLSTNASDQSHIALRTLKGLGFLSLISWIDMHSTQASCNLQLDQSSLYL